MFQIVRDRNSGQTVYTAAWITCSYFILNQQALVHILEALHVARNIVFYIFDAADFEDHELVYGISDATFPFCLDLGQLLANTSVTKEVLLNCVVVAVYAVRK